MRVGIIQSCYIPWRGYFDFIQSVDLFVIFDDVQYPQGRSWRNRNQVKVPHQGLRWLTVPVAHASGHPAIDEVRIGHPPKPWEAAHRTLLTQSLGRAPHFEAAMALWEGAVQAGHTHLSALNEDLLRRICAYLGIGTPLLQSRPLAAPGEKTERLLNLIEAVGGTSYLSGPAAKDYLQVDLFRTRGIGLAYKTYDYPPYPQGEDSFEGTVTILDLIAHLGPEARNHLTSRTPSEVVLPEPQA